MTRCPTCSSLVAIHTTDEGTSSYVPLESDTAGVVIHDEATDALRTDIDFTLHDGRVLRLRLGRGRIVGNDFTHRPGRAL